MRAWAIAKREIVSFFVSPMAYVVLAAWLIWNGLSFWILAQMFAAQMSTSATDSPLIHFFGKTTLFYIPLFVIPPALTMRLIAEEKRTGTIEALLTTPVTPVDVVLGKFFAAMTFWVALWIPTLMYVWITSQYGSVDLGAVGAAYLGVFGLGLVYMSLGLLMSAIAPNQIIAAILTFSAIFGLFLFGLMEFVDQDSPYREVYTYASVWTHMDAFGKGLVDTRYLAYDLTVCVLSLYFSVRVLAAGARGSIVGAVGVGVLGALVGGLLGFAVADDGVTGATAGFVIGGLSGVLVGFELFGVRDAMRSGSRREVLRGWSATLGMFFIVAIAAETSWLSFRHFQRWDWTQQGMYTLSPRTEEVLRGLHDPIDVYVLMSPREPNASQLRELLQLYRARAPGLATHFVDPDRNPAEFMATAQRFGIPVATDPETGEGIASVAAIVTSGPDKKWTITRDDLVAASEETPEQGQRVDLKAEEALTGAIVQATTGRPAKVCVATGHGEWSLTGVDRSLASFKDDVRRDNVEMEEVSTLGLARVPERCDALFVIGPARAYTEAEAGVLEAFVRGGGRLLLALDPVIDRGQFQTSGLEGLTSSFGITVGRDLVIEKDSARLVPPNPPELFLVTTYGEHPITRALRALQGRTAMQLVRSVRAGEASVSLMSTSPDAFSETSLAELSAGREPERNGDDLAGPISLAAAWEAPEAEHPVEGAKRGRLVVIGTAAWLEAPFIESPALTNYDLRDAVTGWLTERDALLHIQPRTIDVQAVFMGGDDLVALGVRVLILLPLAAVLMGLSVWWMRRS